MKQILALRLKNQAIIIIEVSLGASFIYCYLKSILVQEGIRDERKRHVA